jgi:pimeloyl-ACP methyl ester carboxylesterase
VKRVLIAIIILAVVLVGVLGAINFRNQEAFAQEHPPAGRVLTSGLRILQQGEGGQTIVFIHGNPGVAEDFAPVQRLLSSTYRTIAVDRPGYGYSLRPSVKMTPEDQATFIHDALIKDLKLDRPVIAGFSFGGPVSIAYALKYPSELRALVLLCAVGSPAAGHEMSSSQALLAKPLLGPLMAWTVGPLLAPGAVQSGYGEAFSPHQADPATIARGQLQFTRPITLQAAAQDWAVLDGALPGLAERYGAIAVPVEVISANQDRIVGPAHADYLEARIAGAHVERIEGAGHQVMFSYPTQVAAAIERALERSK